MRTVLLFGFLILVTIVLVVYALSQCIHHNTFYEIIIRFCETKQSFKIFIRFVAGGNKVTKLHTSSP